MNDIFRRFAHAVAAIVGSKYAFLVALLCVVIWAALGPRFHYSNTWQLVINTGTTIVTFLVVFLIQYTQNRDTKAMHLKLDELVRAVKEARNSLVDVEEESDQTLEKLQEEFRHTPQQSEQERA
jgi:low affinity Fe/Cu permease